MERLEDEPLTGEVFANEIEYYLQEFCEQRKPPIEDMTTAPQGVWNAALLYIQHHLFKGTNKLKLNNNLSGYKNNNNSDVTSNLNKSNCNAYNISLVNDICDYYIYMCMVYDKEVSAIGFSLLTGIDRYTVATWRDEGTKLSPSCSDIGKKISDFREESLSAKLATAKRNPVGILAILNRHYGWNLPGVSREQQNRKQALTASDLPQLGGANGQNTSMLTDSGAYGDNTADAN